MSWYGRGLGGSGENCEGRGGHGIGWIIFSLVEVPLSGAAVVERKTVSHLNEGTDGSRQQGGGRGWHPMMLLISRTRGLGGKKEEPSFGSRLG